MSMHDQAFRTVELPALPGKLGEIDALLQAGDPLALQPGSASCSSR